MLCTIRFFLLFKSQSSIIIMKYKYNSFQYYFLIYSRYKPTRLWGFSGHVQTIVHSIIGRVKCPWPISERVYIRLNDGTTLTYDLYEPVNNSYEGKYKYNIHILLLSTIK